VTVKRMDNVGIVVEDLDGAVEFFTDLGLRLELPAERQPLGVYAE
jgi:catechol 2,3-dioxygenase-like lactoylglutathione lyase family enzyme